VQEADAEPMPLPPGARLGYYEVVGAIGAGGMGEVYRARDARLNRDVALKVLPASFASDVDRLRRFTLEAQTTGALNHPNVLTIFEVGDHDGQPFLAAELLAGETIREKLSHGPIPVSKANRISGGWKASSDRLARKDGRSHTSYARACRWH